MIALASIVPQLRVLDSLPAGSLPPEDRETAVAALQLILDGVTRQMNDRFAGAATHRTDPEGG